MIPYELQEPCKSRRDLLCHRGVNQRELRRTPAMFEQGTPGPSANSNMIERLTNLSSKGAEPQRLIEGLRKAFKD
jgi:hypothetical protein